MAAIPAADPLPNGVRERKQDCMNEWISGLLLAGVGVVLVIIATAMALRGAQRLSPAPAGDVAVTHDIDHRQVPARAGWIGNLAVATMVCAAIAFFASLFPERDPIYFTTWLSIVFPLVAAIGALLLALSFSPDTAASGRGVGRARLVSLIAAAVFAVVFLLALVPSLAHG